MHLQRQHNFDPILHYWFGDVEKTGLPSEHRNWIWFSGDPAVDAQVKTQFYDHYLKAVRGDYLAWESAARSSLALIILFDQFSRHIYRDSSQAYDQDHRALDLCLKGIEQQFDHQLSLIERVFFYFPLMHAENTDMQSLSLRAYEMLFALSFQESRAIFEKFLDYAMRHHDIISRFGRFPQRNAILGRASTPGEAQFLKNTGYFLE